MAELLILVLEILLNKHAIEIHDSEDNYFGILIFLVVAMSMHISFCYSSQTTEVTAIVLYLPLVLIFFGACCIECRRKIL